MPAITSSRYVVQAGWSDVPHLDEKTQKELLESTPPYLRDARSKGIPSLGAGAIYPVPQEDFKIAPFAIPDHFLKAYGFDVGWKCTAAVWGAKDPDTGIIYLYSEHYKGEALPAIHAQAIKARGDWIKGAIDPAARGRSQKDGSQLFADYSEAGLNIIPAQNAVEAGIYQVWTLLETGRLKVFSTCPNWFDEHRYYRRKEDGQVVKVKDHIMDATRYLIVNFDQIAQAKPAAKTYSQTSQNADRRAGY